VVAQVFDRAHVAEAERRRLDAALAERSERIRRPTGRPQSASRSMASGGAMIQELIEAQLKLRVGGNNG
jgi:hypothetical protein